MPLLPSALTRSTRLNTRPVHTAHRFSCGVMGAGIAFLALSAGAQVQPVIPMQGLEPVVVGSSLPSPVTVKTPSWAVPVGGVGTAPAALINTTLMLVADQLSRGELTPEQAWQKGVIKADDIIQLLELKQRLAPDERNESLKRDLAGILVRFAPEKIADTDKLSARIRIELCHYYSEQGDNRAVPLCETLIKEKLMGKEEKMPTGAAAEPDNPSLWLGAIISLAQFYEHTNQWQKAGETWERALGFWKTANWWEAGVRIDAARAYKKTVAPENQAKAEELYAQVPNFGDSWDTMMARYDHALPLIRAKKFDEAKAILEKPLDLKERSEFGLIAQNSWLAQIAYQRGELEEALHYGEAVVKAGQDVALTNNSVRNLFDQGKEVYLRAGGWKKQPVQCDIKEVVFKANPSHPDQPLYARFRIKTYGDQLITATVDNPNAHVRIMPIDNWVKDDIDSKEKQLEVIIQLFDKNINKGKRIYIKMLDRKELNVFLEIPLRIYE